MCTKTQIECRCGHQGFIRSSENDQPYSAGWERHALEGFTGGTTDETYDRKAGLIAALAPKCPECGQIGEVKEVGYAKRA